MWSASAIPRVFMTMARAITVILFRVSVNSVEPCKELNKTKFYSTSDGGGKGGIKWFQIVNILYTFPSLFSEKKSLCDKIRFIHKFSANLSTRWSPRFTFKAEIILVISYINVLVFPWYLQKKGTNVN